MGINKYDKDFDDVEEIEEVEEVAEEKTSKKDKKKKKKSRNKPWIIALICEILIIVLGAVLFAKAYFTKHYEQMEYVEIDEVVEVNEDLDEATIELMATGYTTIALFGVDSRNATLSDDESTRSDCIIICSINNETGEVKMVSVYRDTYLEFANNSCSYDKITHAYAYGGAELAINTLNKNLDLNITEYVTVNFTALTNAIDALGGLDIELKKSELKKLNQCIDEQIKINGIQADHVTETGTVHLNGVQATAYARIRSTDQGDITRTWRQRKVISLMIEKAKTAGLSALNDAVNAVCPQVSSSLTQSEILSLISKCFDYELTSSTGFPFTWATPTLNSVSYVTACNLENNVVLLHRYLYDDYDYTPSATVQTISANIVTKTGYGNQIDLDTYEIEEDADSIVNK